MEADQLRTFLLQFPEVTEGTPFGEGVVVYKTAGKMFALLSWEDKPLRVNLKCEPLEAERLRDQHACVLPGYHMNKKHWNTVICDGSVSNETLRSWVEHSFERVLSGMTKVQRERLRQLWKNRASNDTQEETEAFRDQLRQSI